MYWTHVGIIIISAQSQSVRITPLVVHVCSSEKAAQLIRIVRSCTLFGKTYSFLCSLLSLLCSGEGIIHDADEFFFFVLVVFCVVVSGGGGKSWW